MMMKIELQHGEWYYDPQNQLGKAGGFGAVFAGTDAAQNRTVAVKKLKITAQDFSHRELRIADELVNRQLAHIIPILDAGLDADSNNYFVVMEKAEKSLQDEIEIRPFSDVEAAEILLQIATGLSKVPEIVHRDLKPDNVLYHENKWKIADFGIARFVEKSTSLRTLKYFRSRYYAAPEQWNYERASTFTDIYALGCIGYALLTGSPPFSGSDEDCKQQHLNTPPPKLDEKHNPRLRSLLSMMLKKHPNTRPGLERVMSLLSKIVDEAEGAALEGFNSLAKVGVVEAEREAQRQAKQNLAESRDRERSQLEQEALRILREDVIETLAETISSAAPSARVLRDQLGHVSRVILGEAWLEVNSQGRSYSEGDFKLSGWDVIVGTYIAGIQDKPEYYVRSASLWYTDLESGTGEYRWYEVSYAVNAAFNREKSPFKSFLLKDAEQADIAAAGRPGKYLISSGPHPIDGENVHEFCNRWMELLAKACEGKLTPPRYLPLA